jgi:hypothetical protein
VMTGTEERDTEMGYLGETEPARSSARLRRRSLTATGPTPWGRIRRWLRMGPTRAELVAEADLWQMRCERSNVDRDETRVRAKAAEEKLRAAERRINELREAARLREPDRVDGCSKVRFHRRAEADDWAAAIARRTGEGVEAYHTYACKVCPRSPVTMRRYWHAGHLGTEEAKAAEAAGQNRRAVQQLDASRAGRLLGQRVDPTVIAKLRDLHGGG